MHCRRLLLANTLHDSCCDPALPSAPNHAEARGAESDKDCVHKLKIAVKELNETSVWLRIIQRANLMKVELLTELIDENQQLCCILNASVKTAQRRQSLSNDQLTIDN